MNSFAGVNLHEEHHLQEPTIKPAGNMAKSCNDDLSLWSDSGATQLQSDFFKGSWDQNYKIVHSVWKQGLPDDDETEESKAEEEVVDNSKAPTLKANPHAVTITSKDDFASSKPTGFQRIVPVVLSGSRAKKESKEIISPVLCSFCKNDSDFRKDCVTHRLKDPTTQMVFCPKLRRFVCPKCGATGDTAHTRKYCPFNQNGLLRTLPIFSNATTNR